MSRFSQFTGGGSSSVPVGSLIQTINLTGAPTGYLALNGACVCGPCYPDLYAVLGAPSPDETFNATINCNTITTCITSTQCKVPGTMCLIRHCGEFKMMTLACCCSSCDSWAAMLINSSYCIECTVPLCFSYGNTYGNLNELGVNSLGEPVGTIIKGGWGSGGTGLRLITFNMANGAVACQNCSTSEPYYNKFCACSGLCNPEYILRSGSDYNLTSWTVYKVNHANADLSCCIANTAVCCCYTCDRCFGVVYTPCCYVPAAIFMTWVCCCCLCSNCTQWRIIRPRNSDCVTTTCAVSSYAVKPYCCYSCRDSGSSYDTTYFAFYADDTNGLTCIRAFSTGTAYFCFGKAGGGPKPVPVSGRFFAATVSSGTVSDAINVPQACCFPVSAANCSAVACLFYSSLLDKSYITMRTYANNVQYCTPVCCHCCAIWCCSCTDQVYSSGTAGTEWPASCAAWSVSSVITTINNQINSAPPTALYNGTTVYGGGTVPAGLMILPCLTTGINGVCYYVKY